MKCVVYMTTQRVGMSLLLTNVYLLSSISV
jgi:hypothetical protein